MRERDGGKYSVSLAMGLNEKLWDKAGTEATWTIRGDGLRPTAVTEDEQGGATLGEETITVEGTHGVILTFAAERTGLGIGAIVGILAVLAFLGLLLAVGIVAFLNRAKLKALFGGSAGGSSEGQAGSGPAVADQAGPVPGAEGQASPGPAAPGATAPTDAGMSPGSAAPHEGGGGTPPPQGPYGG
ncbi:hypothetical protein [Brachybacterium sp. 107]|uniref:hypothetical protein n=1 Tax=Brachybacterium sp. 107 TaxID=3457736 RepID=UPI0040346140